jgi:hypothetical protein
MTRFVRGSLLRLLLLSALLAVPALAGDGHPHGPVLTTDGDPYPRAEMSAPEEESAEEADADDTEKKDEKKEWSVEEPEGDWGWKEVPIEVDEGTWMSVDVAPDGRELVFDLLGDLYTLPIGGGEAKALTSGIAWDEQPRYSPDGESIVFTSDRGGGDNLWIVDRDGANPRQVTKEKYRLLNSPAWSPDGEWIAARKHFTKFRSAGAGEIWLYHRSGGDGLQLTEKPNDQKDLGEPAFSPDGRYVYFSQDTTPGPFFEYNKDSNKQIYVIRRFDRETGRDRRLGDGTGRRHPPDAVAGRRAAGVHPPRPLPVDALRAGRCLRRRARPLLGARPRSPGGVGDPRRLPRHELDAGRRGDRGLGRREAPPGRRRLGGGDHDSLPRERHAQGRGGAALPGGGGAVDVSPDDAPRRRSGARRRVGRLRDPRPAVDPAAARRHGAAADETGRPHGGVPRFLARRQVDRLRHLRRSAARRRSRRRRRRRREPGADAGAGPLLRAGVLARRQDRGLSQGARQLAARPGVGARARDLRRARRRRPAGQGHRRRRRTAFRRDPQRVFVLRRGDEDKRTLASLELGGSDERTHATSEAAVEFRLSPDGKWLAFAERYRVW